MKGKKSLKKVVICTLSVIVILVIACVALYVYKFRTKTLVVVKVYDNYILCYEDSLYSIGTSNMEDLEFKEGQEILVFYDGGILTSYPAQLSGKSKIFILKQESDIVIPDYVMKYAFSSKNNVNISVEKISNTGMTYTIEDTNEFQYNYEDTYTLYKRNDIEGNEEAQEIEFNSTIIIEEGNMTAPSYNPENIVLEWEELKKGTYGYVTEQLDGNIIRRTCDWTTTYETLETGDYYFSQGSDGLGIQIYFSIDESGEVSDIEIKKLP